jgi:hypothetical protein
MTVELGFPLTLNFATLKNLGETKTLHFQADERLYPLWVVTFS